MRRLRHLPSAILKGCTALARLSLHGNPITLEQLREADGWAEFKARRCAKADKQLEMQVGAAAWLRSAVLFTVPCRQAQLFSSPSCRPVTSAHRPAWDASPAPRTFWAILDSCVCALHRCSGRRLALTRAQIMWSGRAGALRHLPADDGCDFSRPGCSVPCCELQVYMQPCD